jgi:hypothetical protein
VSVYKAIAAVTGELSKTGISKDRKNDQQGYKFRGIDDVYNALAGLLSAHSLCLLPRVTNRHVTERTTVKGTVLYYVVLDVEYDIVHEDGSKHTVAVVGEAMDSGDKATNKAMSAAYKYMALQVFCIPTEGDNDADKTTHEVAAPPPLPEDVKTLLTDASKESMDALKDAWKSLAVESRELIAKHYESWWAERKQYASRRAAP